MQIPSRDKGAGHGDTESVIVCYCCAELAIEACGTVCEQLLNQSATKIVRDCKKLHRTDLVGGDQHSCQGQQTTCGAA